MHINCRGESLYLEKASSACDLIWIEKLPDDSLRAFLPPSIQDAYAYHVERSELRRHVASTFTITSQDCQLSFFMCCLFAKFEPMIYVKLLAEVVGTSSLRYALAQQVTAARSRISWQ